MNKRDLEKLDKLHHLSDYDLKSLITEVGLYEPILIDLSEISFAAGTNTFGRITVGKDVKALHKLVNGRESIELPCPECGKIQPFKQYESILPRKLVPINSSGISGDRPNYNYKKIEGEQLYGLNVSYHFGSDAIKSGNFEANQRDQVFNDCVIRCREGILGNNGDIRKEFECSLHPEHKVWVEFFIIPATDGLMPEEIKANEKSLNSETSDKELFNLYMKYRYSLAILKVGQYPSMMDMQLVNTEKYRNLLGKRYRDLTLAIALHADGIGCGSFLYLRRVFAFLVDDIHKECISDSQWNEAAYKNASFNDKIKLIENTGRKIIPDELQEVRAQIYSVLSKGVHESTDDECKAIFPNLLFAIENILDKQLYKKDRQKRLSSLRKSLNRF